MKKIVFVSMAILGISLSLVYASTDDVFLNKIEYRVSNQVVLTPVERVKLLSLSSEQPKNIMRAKTNLSTRAKRHYFDLVLKKSRPFYQKRVERIIDEPSIDIVKRKDKLSREKALRYRVLFSQ